MSKKILFIAAMPPPVHGQSTVNLSVYQKLIDNKCNVNLFDVSPSVDGGRFLYHFSRIKKYFIAWIYIVFFASRTDSVYTVYESGFGYIYNILTLLLFRLKRGKFFLHHHTAAHTKFFSRRFYLLCKIFGNYITHIVLSENMMEDVRVKYNQKSFIVSTNAYSIDEMLLNKNETKNRASEEIRIGLMSNLSKEKGLYDSIDVVNDLLKNNYNCRLILAGPIKKMEDKLFLKSIVENSNGKIEYIGPVFGEDKKKYFENIDVFLFPSSYRYEAQPLVVLEAMASGCPVFAINAGYTGELLPDKNWYFGCVDDFNHGVAKLIINYINNPKDFDNDSSMSRRHFVYLKNKSIQEKNDMINLLVVAGS